MASLDQRWEDIKPYFTKEKVEVSIHWEIILILKSFDKGYLSEKGLSVLFDRHVLENENLRMASTGEAQGIG